MSYNPTPHVPPLEVCERLIGPKLMLAEICGYTDKTPYGWARQSVWRPANHLPPAAQLKLLAHIKAKALPIPGDWLIAGASIDDVLRAEHEIKRGRAA